MNSRRLLLLSVLSFAVAAWYLTAVPAPAQDSPANPSLRDMLQKNLHAVFPNQVAFINRVVHLVNIGVLPREMVLGTYQWAIREDRTFPYPIFAFAMRAQAKKIGVAI